MPKLAVIIVNYNAAHVLSAHVDKLLAEIDGDPVYIVDNASPNGDLPRLRQMVDDRALHHQVTIIDAGANLGFAAGNNLAFKEVKAKQIPFALFINPDAYPEPGAIKKMLAFLEATPTAAIAGAQLVETDGKLASCRFAFPTAFREFAQESGIGFLVHHAFKGVSRDHELNDPLETEWVSGAAFMMRTEAAPSPLMDERFFLYYEETDMMRTIRAAGWKNYIVPTAKVVHIGGVSTGVDHDSTRGPRLPIYWFNSWRLYFRKNGGWPYIILVAVAKTLGIVLAYLKCAVRGRAPWHPQHYLSDVFKNCLVASIPPKEHRS